MRSVGRLSPISSVISLLGSDISPVQAQCAAPSPPSSFTLPEFHPTPCFSSPSFFPPKPEGIFHIPTPESSSSLISEAHQYLCLVDLRLDLFPPSPLGGAPSLPLPFPPVTLPYYAFSGALRQKQDLSCKASHCQKISPLQLFISFLQLIADASGPVPALHPSSTLQNSSAIVEDLPFARYEAFGSFPVRSPRSFRSFAAVV